MKHRKLLTSSTSSSTIPQWVKLLMNREINLPAQYYLNLMNNKKMLNTVT